MRCAVILAVHNAADSIEETVRSVASQESAAHGLAMFDDGSTDDTPEVVAGLLKELSADGFSGGMARIEQRVGFAAARNELVRMLWHDTDVFAILPQEAAYLPGALELALARFTEDPEHTGLVYGDERVEVVGSHSYLRYREPFSVERAVEYDIFGPCYLVSKLALERCGLFDEECGDAALYDLALRVAERTSACHVPVPLTRLRMAVGMSAASRTVDETSEGYHVLRAKARARHAKRG